MKLDYISIAGFRGFRDPVTFNFGTGFTVICGRNGAGKSTVLDAIDFVLTGTINKFTNKSAALADHLWWVGTGANQHYVKLGLLNDDGTKMEISRTRDGLVEPAGDPVALFCTKDAAPHVKADALIQTTIIRDELISADSMDLPGQARFTALRDAIGVIAGDSYSPRAQSISKAADAQLESEKKVLLEVQARLSANLSVLTNARSEADKFNDVSAALKTMEKYSTSTSALTAETAQTLVKEVRARLARFYAAYNLARQIAFDQAEDFRGDLARSRLHLDEAEIALQEAEQAYQAAERALQDERDADTSVTHYAELISHGEAVGLQNGHCPLCAAVRTAKEFEAAIQDAKNKFAAHGVRIASLVEARDTVREVFGAKKSSRDASRQLVIGLEQWFIDTEKNVARVKAEYEASGYPNLPADDLATPPAVLAELHKEVGDLDLAIQVMQVSSTIDRIRTIENSVSELRKEVDTATNRVVRAELATQFAKQIVQAAVAVPNEILMEQFDTVLPLFKELYRRLKPHLDWTEIDSDFTGRIRGSLNFTVGEGYNPQYLFSSGQRRAAGLAFLLAIHLSRPWCSWNSLLMDDPVQHIDDYRAINLVEVLSSIRRTGRQVIVAVEDEALADLLCRRLRGSAAEPGRRFDIYKRYLPNGVAIDVSEIAPLAKQTLRLAASR